MHASQQSRLGNWEAHGKQQRGSSRSELRETAGVFLDGLLSGVERRTGWLLAEQAGVERAYRIQSLLGRGRWEADALRDHVRTYAIEASGTKTEFWLSTRPGL